VADSGRMKMEKTETNLKSIFAIRTEDALTNINRPLIYSLRLPSLCRLSSEGLTRKIFNNASLEPLNQQLPCLPKINGLSINPKNNFGRGEHEEPLEKTNKLSFQVQKSDLFSISSLSYPLNSKIFPLPKLNFFNYS
jgi:hypothetical protein